MINGMTVEDIHTYGKGRNRIASQIKNVIWVFLFAIASITMMACESDASVASRNVSKAADFFEVDRRIVFYNGITDTYMLTIEGRCSIEDQLTQLEVICKVGEQAFKKHFLGLSDNVTYFAEQLDAIGVSAYHHRVTFKPQQIVPELDFRISPRDALETVPEINKDENFDR